MVTVRELLETKGHEVWTVGPEASVYEALEMMAEKNIGALPVVENGAIVGIFTERDYARRVALVGRSSKEMKVCELMIKSVLYVGADGTAEGCMTLMTEKRVRHLPVMAGDKLAGIISIGDVVNNIISDQKHTIRDLENYITGRGYGA